jgi:hypothetical protein
VAGRAVFTSQFGLGKALAADPGHCQLETLAVIHVFAVVEAEHLLIKVAIYCPVQPLGENSCELLNEGPERLR